MFRKTLFWAHLACGVVIGLVVIMMSVTGVLLTYERQMLAWADRAAYDPPAQGTARQPIDALLAAVELSAPDFEPSSITLPRDPRAPASVGAGRSGTVYVDAFSGRVLGQGAERLRSFFGAVTGWHRWFNASGENRAVPRAITGASNLAFLFLIASGLYLWLPRVWKWPAFRARLAFTDNPSSKARDFNWHHVFGIWTAVPLAVVVATAVVFSYGWGNDLVYRSVGEEPPVRGRRGGPPQSAARPGPRVERVAARAESARARSPAPLSLDALFDRAAQQLPDWNRITVDLPQDRSSPVRFTIDTGNGGQPQRRHNLTLDALTGEVHQWQPFSSQSTGRRARSYIRFLHTGEALGVLGQTVAGIVSATSVLMVWTGLALAYRRLIAPLFRKNG
jgi:uncharacterized iron-regulated membrane protein